MSMYHLGHAMNFSPQHTSQHHLPARSTSEWLCLVLSRASDGVLPRPLPRRRLVSGAVRLVDVCNFGDERVVRVGVGEHGADGEED